MYGSEEYHVELRARAALEIAMRRPWYDHEHPDYCAPFNDEPFIVCPAYVDLCTSVVSSGHYADIMSILALSSVVGLRIQMFFPRLTPSLEAHPLTRCLVDRGVDDTARSIAVMWTSLDSATLPITINHFVPLCKNVVNVAAAETVSDDSSGDGDEPDGDGSDDGRDNEGDADDSDVPEGDDAADQQHQSDDTDDFEPAVKRSRVVADNGNGSGIVSDEDVSNATVTPIIKHRPNSDNTLSRFHSSREVYELLLSATPDVILQDVLTGRKENCFFVVDNTQNPQRKLGNQKNRFWDDCGVWDSQRSRNLTSTFVKSPTGETRYTLQCVEQREGNYCVKRRLNKQVVWEPLQPQPAQVNVVVLCLYYATLKASYEFRKRVTWLKNKPDVVLFEYVGTAPEVKTAHGALRRTSDPEFVRTHPRVLDKLNSQHQ